MNYSISELRELFVKRNSTVEILQRAVCDMREAMENMEAPSELPVRFYLTANLALIITNKDYFNEMVDIGSRIVSMNISEKANMEANYGLHLLYSCIGFTPKLVELGLKVIDSPIKNNDILLSVYSSLAIACKEYGLTDKAVEYTRDGCSMGGIPEEEKPLKVRLVSANNIAMIYLDNGRLEEALENRAKIMKLMEDNPDDPEVSPLYPLVHFSILLIDAHTEDNVEALKKYVEIMDKVMVETESNLVARQTLAPHITFLNKLYEAGKLDEAKRIAEYIQKNPIRFFGNRTGLYKVLIRIYVDKCINGVAYNQLLMDYIEELERYKSEHEAVEALLIKEQYRIREVDSKYNVIRKKLEDDSLTHCHNRQSFQLNGKDYLDAHKNGSLVFIDLDNLKKTNDRYGHSAGDRLLIDFVRCVNRAKSDDVMFYRYAGDEFILLTPMSIGFAEELIDKITKECSKVSGRAGEELGLKFSYGIAGFSEKPDSLDEVIDLADMRMYECKKKHHQSKSS